MDWSQWTSPQGVATIIGTLFTVIIWPAWGYLAAKRKEAEAKAAESEEARKVDKTFRLKEIARDLVKANPNLVKAGVQGLSALADKLIERGQLDSDKRKEIAGSIIKAVLHELAPEADSEEETNPLEGEVRR